MAAAAAQGGKTREDRQKEKALLEARKAGTVAPEKDADGNDINPHIPAYIANAPWYLNATAPGLKHQKSAFTTQHDKTWYTRGATQGPAATKYRKGACTNCGSMTHDAKACVERPRKLGARWTNKDIRPDEVIQAVSLDYEGKRDRWNGYDPAMHALLMEQFEKTEEEKKKRKEELLQQNLGGDSKTAVAGTEAGTDASAGAGAGSEVDGGAAAKVDEDEFGIRDDSGVNDAPIAKMDPKTRTTIRNLRIREDTAKYLRNLDPESAYYDPKSRSMREDPTPHIAAEDRFFVTYGSHHAQKQFAGDNFVRGSGEVAKFHEVTSFAWDAYERGQDVHLQALPSQAELLLRQFKEKKEQLKKDVKADLLAKYGGEEHLAAPKEMLPEQSEAYVEYSRHGKPIKGADKVIVRSRYEEDVLANNHTKVWGSWWENGRWGYGCCRQLLKNSFCTGQAGIAAKESVIETQLANAQRATQKAEAAQAAQEAGGMTGSAAAHKAKMPFEKEAQPELDPVKLEKAMQAEEKRRQQPVERDERKRAYNSMSGMGSTEVTQEEMEAYRRRKTMMEDPMAQMKDS